MTPLLRRAYLAAGKQGNLKAWLASASLTQPPASQQPCLETCAHLSIGLSSENSSEGSAAPREALGAGAGASVLGKRPGAKSGNARQKAVKQKGAAGQSSLRAFMKPQAAPRAGPTQPPPVPAQAAESLATFSEPARASQQPHGSPRWRSQARDGAKNGATSSLGEASVSSTALPDTEVVKHESGSDAPIVNKQPLSDRGQSLVPTQEHPMSSQGALSREQAVREQHSRAASGEQGAAGAAAEAAHLQSASSCAKAVPDELDELVAAATQWEDIKGGPFGSCVPFTTSFQLGWALLIRLTLQYLCLPDWDASSPERSAGSYTLTASC